MSDDIQKPTSEQCSANARLPDWNGIHVYAAWYPQIAGCADRAVVRFNPDDSSQCFDAIVWHDGTSPFADRLGNPYAFHCCRPMPLNQFGRAVLSLQAKARNRK